MKKFKQSLRWFWLALAVAFVAFYVVNPSFFSAENLKLALNDDASLVLTIFIVFSCVRALLFLPSTIFVLMGTVLYPQSPFFVLTISMLGILIGASLVYKAAAILTSESFFNGKNLTRLGGVHLKMKMHGFWIVLLWSLFPAVPTDLICYVAGTIKMSFWKFIFAVFLGEIILVYLYIWTGKSLIGLIF